MLEMKTLSSQEEWLEARKGFIGGSDASCIVGANPWKSNLELWQEKTGLVVPEDISEKPFIKYGHAAEPLLRQLFALDFPEYEVLYEENNIWFNSKYPFAHASLDGWLIEKETGRKGIWECKTTNILQSMQKEKWKDQIPNNYYIQILHYLMVTGWDFAILKAQLKFDYSGDISCQIRHYKIERSDVEDDIAFLAEAEKEFWKLVKLKKKPDLILPEI